MMRAIVMTMVLLAGCGGGAEQPAARPPLPEQPSAVQNTVAALPDNQRNAVLIRAIRDAGLDCQGVTGSRRQGVGSRGDPLYVAQCSGGASYGVLIGRDGTAQVVAAPRS